MLFAGYVLVFALGCWFVDFVWGAMLICLGCCLLRCVTWFVSAGVLARGFIRLVAGFWWVWFG